MKNIAAQLGFVFCFCNLCAAHDGDGARVETLAKTTASWDGAMLPAYPAGQPEITVLRITIPPKTRLPLHKHGVINAGVLLSGRLTVVAEDGKTLRLSAGDSIVELVDRWHYGKNDGDRPAVIVVFYAGAKGRPITVERSEKSQRD